MLTGCYCIQPVLYFRNRIMREQEKKKLPDTEVRCVSPAMGSRVESFQSSRPS